MEHFDTERQAVTVTHKGKTVTYYIRELGYYEFQEINLAAALAHPQDKERRGLQVLHQTAVAAIEDKDGNAAFDLAAWKRLPRGPADELTHAAMLAQGVDLKKAQEEAHAEGDSEGNA